MIDYLFNHFRYLQINIVRFLYKDNKKVHSNMQFKLFSKKEEVKIIKMALSTLKTHSIKLILSLTHFFFVLPANCEMKIIRCCAHNHESKINFLFFFFIFIKFACKSHSCTIKKPRIEILHPT